jgi:Ala-tRNA(Pro) deacylase
MWLVSTLEDQPIDLKTLGAQLGGRLSFASAERLLSYLGILPGAVSPLAVINDRTQAVTVILVGDDGRWHAELSSLKQ